MLSESISTFPWAVSVEKHAFWLQLYLFCGLVFTCHGQKGVFSLIFMLKSEGALCWGPIIMQFKYESIFILWNYVPLERLSVLLTMLSHVVLSVGFRQSAVDILGCGNSSLKCSSVLWDHGSNWGRDEDWWPGSAELNKPVQGCVYVVALVCRQVRLWEIWDTKRL